MKKIIALIVVAAIIFVFFCVKNSSSPVDKLEKFTANVEQEYDNYDQDALNKTIADFNEIVESIDASKLSDTEKLKVTNYKGRCKTYFAKAKARLVVEKIKGVAND